MRADEPITQCRLYFGSYYEKINADYINKLRVDRLKKSATIVRDNMNLDSMNNWGQAGCLKKMSYDKYLERLERIAEALEECAKRIKESM